MIYCLMFSFGLTDEMRWALFYHTGELIKLGRTKSPIASDCFDGFVQTTGKTVMMGGMSGVEFEAYIESNRGKGAVRYLVRSGDLPDPDELEIVPFPFDDEAN